MDALLSIRLRLKECPIAPPAEPVLRVGTTCVGALWECGCACVGEDFDSVHFVGCTLHGEYMGRLTNSRAAVPAGPRYATTVKGDEPGLQVPRRTVR
jgi:hypothetical protein